ncbi:alpha/beta hydrolase [Stratiformator vulcanicus]|uniref:Carboxylesterase NlhH n=1 Tax=Stratiformator vulcanicus TaxID=2527980 RepID=A0A517QW96_9PLAN|nr:alpha/beta hydrolase [Stratiformator vulcanicus]QDT35874.1 Carboxylesterase NlhH [Stratiformator vulcanicus]
MKAIASLAAALLLIVSHAATADDAPQREEIVYKHASDSDLKLHVYRPAVEESDEAQARPAIVFFFGGGWAGGDPKQFFPHCEHFAKRGIVAISAEYRVHSRHRVKPAKCLEDARDAIRYVRDHADEWGVDPNRIVSSGGSAGGHLAACLGVIEEQVRAADVTSSESNAMILFNPALIIANVEGEELDSLERHSKLSDRFGGPDQMRALCPYRHVGEDEPPTLIVNGIDDPLTKFEGARAFAQKMHDNGNRCVVVGYPKQVHGFFNANRGGNTMYNATLDEADRFLVSLGYLPPKPASPNLSDELDATRVGE